MKKSLKSILLTLSLALVMVLATGALVEAKAADLTYDATKDIVTANGKFSYAIIKSEDGSKAKVKDFKEVDTKTGEEIAPKDLGASSIKKPILVYTVATTPEEDVEKAKPNFIVKANEIQKFTVALNYKSMESAAVATTDNKAAFSISYPGEDKKNPIVISDSTKLDALIEWKLDADGAEWQKASELDKCTLYDYSNATDKITLYFRAKGSATTRPSAAVKVKVTQTAKAPSVKVDFTKGTINIKNGYDFAVSGTSFALKVTETVYESKGKEVEIYNIANGDYTTVIPFNKEGKHPSKDGLTDCTAYTPVKSAKDAPEAYTSVSVKSLNLMEMFGPEAVDVFVRKSATVKAPASKAIRVVVPAVPDCPEVGGISATDIATGAAASFKLTTSATGAALQFAVVKKADIGADNLEIKWSKYTPGKTYITPKTKTNYKKGKTSVKDLVKLDGSTLILLRCGGVKAKGTTPGSLPSDYLVTTLDKDTDGSALWKFIKLSKN